MWRTGEGRGLQAEDVPGSSGRSWPGSSGAMGVLVGDWGSESGEGSGFRPMSDCPKGAWIPSSPETYNFSPLGRGLISLLGVFSQPCRFWV